MRSRTFSFEFFPPQTPEGIEKLRVTRKQLVQLKPAFFSVTFGAGGSTRERTMGTVLEIQAQGHQAAPHVSCIASTKTSVREILQRYKDAGIKRVVALRGDMPSGMVDPGEFRYANELVSFIRREFPAVGIAVAGYPETHQEATSPDADLANLKRKVDAGADVVITQLFYNNDDFFRFRDRCRAAGVSVPIVPGLLPVTNLAQIQRIASLCGARLPDDFVAQLQQYADDDKGQFEVGVEFAARQAAELLAAEVPGMHFYVLNKSEATKRVLTALRR